MPHFKINYFNLSADTQTVTDIDTQKIQKDLIGLNQAKVIKYFQGHNEIEHVKIKISPFWRKTIPQKTTKIKIEVLTP